MLWLLILWIGAHAKAHACANDVLYEIGGDPDLTSFYGFLSETPGLVQQLNSLSELTVFAPTNASFKSLDLEAISLLKRNLDFRAYILEFHLSHEIISERKARQMNALLMLNGRLTSLMVIDGSLWIDGSVIVASDTKLCNGVMHKIDRVLGL